MNGMGVFGWNNPGNMPPYLENENTSVKKVEISDAYDLKRWWWKANDGIMETTWPGVHNRSFLPGRTDYFILPDWDCYDASGWAVDFLMPDEPWNYVEMCGAAFGKAYLKDNREDSDDQILFSRKENQQRSFHKIDGENTGKVIAFKNDVKEKTINEFNAFYVTGGKAPQGKMVFSYKLQNNSTGPWPTHALMI